MRSQYWSYYQNGWMDEFLIISIICGADVQPKIIQTNSTSICATAVTGDYLNNKTLMYRFIIIN